MAAHSVRIAATVRAFRALFRNGLAAYQISLAGLLFGCFAWSSGLFALELPPEVMAKLNSEKFAEREDAQVRLLEWSRERREAATDQLYLLSRKAEDPEVRERCLAVLRELVHDEYLNEGEGYIGIMMRDEIANVPGDPAPRSVIRVIRVVPDSGAARAGLLLNDLIVALDDQTWRDDPASLPFSEKIRQLGPNDRVKLKVMREGEVKDIEVTLGRRPAFAGNPLVVPGNRIELPLRIQGNFLGNLDFEAAQKSEKEAHFRQWLERRKAAE